MYSINKIETSEIIIKNSRFITILMPITSKSNITNILDKIKEKYPKANHYCYAYITENSQKSSDDKEPSSTAGIPMLNVLIKNNIINVLAVTVRYFGGIKLGAGGLIRAYSKSVTMALKNTKLIELEDAIEIEIYVEYNNQKNIENILKTAKITEKEFTDKIKYIAIIPISIKDKLNNYEYKILNEKCYLEKYEYES